MKRKALACVLTAAMALALFTGCGTEGMVSPEPGRFRDYGGAADSICSRTSRVEYYLDHRDCGGRQL